MIKYVTQSCDCNVITARRDPTTAGPTLTCICRPGREYQQQAMHMSLCQELHTSVFYHGHSPTAVSWPTGNCRGWKLRPPPRLPRCRHHRTTSQGSDSHTVSEYFNLKVTFKVAILKSGLHQHLLLIYCCAVYIGVMLSLKPGVE